MRKRLNIIGFVIFDFGAIILSYYISFWLRFDGDIDMNFLNIFFENWYAIVGLKIFVFWYFKLYRSMWKYASVGELMQIGTGVVISNIAVLAYITLVGDYLPRSIYVIAIAFDMAFIGGFRFLFRTRLIFKSVIPSKSKRKVMIVGAGSAAAMLIKELRNHTELESVPVVIIDDNKTKIGMQINGIPVLGSSKDIVYLADKKKIDEIIIAIPSANRQDMKRIINECKKTSCKLKTLPGLFEIIDGKVDIKNIRDVNIEDLLGRDVVKLDTEGINEFIEGKTVLVTGGGGSIGSELCRQIVRYNPKKLIIFDIHENSVYSLQQELKNKVQSQSVQPLTVLIGSVRDSNRLEEVFEEYRPDVIFHAAAHKHVPLMEDNPKEAVKNNIIGTYNVAKLASKYEIEKFVLISTDKAVNPTNVMGASKRVCEMIIQAFDRSSNTEFAAVRFGNVLGSSGSVIPLFKKQIEDGGPVTVTHKDVIRFFMTIPEAVSLVIEAGAMAQGGEIFILDMGEPVRIYDLAKDLIRLSGLEPEVDIPIEFIGLRPGEKLFEELLLSEEGLKKTENNKIYIAKPVEFSLDEIKNIISRFKEVLNNSNEDIINLLEEIVPTYKRNV